MQHVPKYRRSLFRQTSRHIGAVLFCLFALSNTSARADEPRLYALPPLAISIGETTTSGISSGAYMAGQFQLAHSDIITGTAIIAGGPWGCAQSAFSPFVMGAWGTALNFNRAASGCMLNLMQAFGVPSASVLASRAKRMAKRGDIAPIETVKTHRVFILSGTRDVVVRPSIVRAARRFYGRLGVPDENVVMVDVLPSGHGFVTETEGGVCGSSATPFVVDCDYDLAGAVLGHFYGPLKPRAATPDGAFLKFDQKPFVDDLRSAGLDAEGRVFVPTNCAQDEGCRVHIAFHGCKQNRASVGEIFVERSGLANWASANRIVVLFPQTRARADNPQGCWDWWGYTGPEFLTKRAPQIVAVRRMLEALAGAPLR